MYVKKVTPLERVKRALLKTALMLIIGIFGLIAAAIPGGLTLLLCGVVLEGIDIITMTHQTSTMVMEGGLILFCTAGIVAGIIITGLVFYKAAEAEYGLWVNKNL